MAELGAGIGAVGFSSQQWVNTTAGELPGLTTAYRLMSGTGTARSFTTTASDAVVVNMGTNGGAALSEAVTTVNNPRVTYVDTTE